MPSLEVQFLVGAESKKWLSDFTELVERLEKAAPKGAKGKTDAVAKSFNDDEDEEQTVTHRRTEESFDSDDEGNKQEASADEDEDTDFTAKPETKKKAKKLTVDDVNDACKARAAVTGGKEGRKEVLGILKKKFKVESVSDLKEDAYAACIAAMKA